MNAAASSSPHLHGQNFRTDIAGLRAVAVAAVVLFHAGALGIPGGFVGVDVFFVISGFLITRILLTEIDSTGRIDLGRFWMRRARRLMPAAAVVAVVTLALSAALASPLAWGYIAKTGAAAMVYGANLVFAFEGSDYFAEDLQQLSPFLHTWSLGVEEQFYIVLPLVLLVIAAAARRLSPRARRTSLILAIVVASLLSLVASIVVTPLSAPHAFYLMPTRFWEFGVGGLLGILGHKLRLAHGVREALAAVGAAGLLASLLLIDESLPFPGSVAIAPVFATAALIAAGTTRADARPTVVGRVLSVKPMTVVGDLSYSLYLWHWPVILFVPLALPDLDRALQMTLAVALSVGLAALTYHAVENPVRFSPRLSASVRRSALASLGFLLVPMVAASALAVAYLDVERRNQVILEARSEIPASDGGIPNVVPAIQQSELTIVLVGDSHAAHWQTAFERAAAEAGATLYVLALNSCTPINVTTVDLEGDIKGSCAEFREKTREFLSEVKPDVIVLSQAEGYLGRIRADDRSELPEHEQLTLWQERYEAWLTEVAPLASSLGVVIDNPRIPFEPNECLIEAAQASECDAPRDEALAMTSALQEASAAARAATSAVTSTFSVTEELCTPDVCRVTVDGLPVYRDFNHLSERWTLTQVPRISEFFQELVKPTR